jgi:hypothetical protein
MRIARRVRKELREVEGTRARKAPAASRTSSARSRSNPRETDDD